MDIKEMQNNISKALFEDNMFHLLFCPVCGHECSHVFVKELNPEVTKTRQGGYLISIDFECGHSLQYVVAEHKGYCVAGRFISGAPDE